MAIITSIVVSMSPQIDGRIWVVEQHLDEFNQDHPLTYLAPAGTTSNQAATVCTNNGGSISTQVAASEIAANIFAVATLGMNAVVTFNESTPTQNAAAVRAAYALMTQTQAIFTGEYLSTLSNAALQNAFSLTAGQVTTLRTNFLTPAANAAATIRATKGT